MDKARNSRRCQTTSEPMDVCGSQESRKKGLEDWTEMMNALNQISKQAKRTSKGCKEPYDERKNYNKGQEKSYSTERQREKDKNRHLQKELEQVSGLNKELNERYQREKDRCKALQKQLDKASVTLQEVNTRYKMEIDYVRQKVYNLQDHLDKEIKQKKALQADYDKLQAAYTLNKQKFSAKCDTEKIKSLQHELETIHVSHRQLRQLYDTDVVTVRQEAETLQRELDRETKAHADTVSEGWRVINTLRAEQDALHQKMAEVNNIQQNGFERERTFKRELEGLKAQLKEQISVNLKLSTELQAEKEHYGTPRKRIRREDKDECKPMKKQATINFRSPLGRIKGVKMSEKTELQAEKEDYGTPRKRNRRKDKDECEPMKKQATINFGSPLGPSHKSVKMSEKNL